MLNFIIFSEVKESIALIYLILDLMIEQTDLQADETLFPWMKLFLTIIE